MTIPEHLICSCGEPMKINLDKRLPPIGCPKCNSEVNFDDPEVFDEVFRLLREYWLRLGRRDYAGLDDGG
jgi:hypothetical protein